MYIDVYIYVYVYTCIHVHTCEGHIQAKGVSNMLVMYTACKIVNTHALLRKDTTMCTNVTTGYEHPMQGIVSHCLRQ